MTPISKLVTSKKKLVNRNKLTSYEIRVRALTIAKGLTSTTPPNDMTAWYCKAFKVLGESRYTAIAAMAREPGVIKQKNVFGTLLSEEVKAAESRIKNE